MRYFRPPKGVVKGTQQYHTLALLHYHNEMVDYIHYMNKSYKDAQDKENHIANFTGVLKEFDSIIIKHQNILINLSRQREV